MMQQENGKINIVLHENNKDGKENNISYFKNNEKLKFIENQFSSFVGLQNFKNIIKEIYATKLINEKRLSLGLQVNEQVLHMVFNGNPGTGKTTIARKLARVLYDLDILTKGHFIEVERADLVGEYIGQTAQKTRAVVQKALGGVLFIDEAYSLARGGNKDFGREAIDTIVKQMEDFNNEFILILAGYPYEMEKFLLLNPGLKSRFPFHVSFQDYDCDQLLKIANQFATESEYELSKEMKWKLRQHIRQQILKNEAHFANARYIRNIIENCIRMQAVRLLNQNNYTVKDLVTIRSEDLYFNV